MALLILIFGVLSITRMPTDMFPSIDIPVVSIIWQYGGLSPDEMEKRVVSTSERSYTTTVGNIEHIESQSMAGISVIRSSSSRAHRSSQALSQLAAASQTVLRAMPPGMTPPLILQYNAADVPILQMSLSSDTMSITDIVGLRAELRAQPASDDPGCIGLPRHSAAFRGGCRWTSTPRP